MLLAATNKLIQTAKNALSLKTHIKYIINASLHFQERMIQRFDEVDYPALEKTIEKAIEKANPGEFRYTHPYYNITVVINKMGINGAELVTCWKGDAKC